MRINNAHADVPADLGVSGHTLPAGVAAEPRQWTERDSWNQHERRLQRRPRLEDARAHLRWSQFCWAVWNWTELTVGVLRRGNTTMKKKRFTDEQITYALRQVEAGTSPAEICRRLGCSEASFYIWKKRYGDMGMTEVKELRQLRDENARLKRLVADLTLDKNILAEVVRKSSEADTTARAPALDTHAVSDRRDSFVSAGGVLADSMVSTGPRSGSSAAENEDSRYCRPQTSARLRAHSRHAETRGLAGEQEACAQAISPGRAAVAHSDPSSQAHVPAPRSRSPGTAHARALEYGFCARSVVRWQAISDAHRDRSV